MIRTPAAFLTDGEVHRVHEASLEILEDVGLLVRNARARGKRTFSPPASTLQP